MLKNIKALLLFVLTLSILLCALALPAFAEGDSADSSSEGSSSSSTTEEEKKEPTAFEKWWDSYNQIVGYVIAGVVFVAGVIGVILWIPKNTDKKKKNNKK